MKEKKNMNTYLKYTLILLGSMFLGGIVGIGLVMVDVESCQLWAGDVIRGIRANLLWLLLVISAVGLICGEFCMRRLKAVCRQITETLEDDADELEYEFEKQGSLGTILMNVTSVLSILVLSTGYSKDYIASQAGKNQGLMAAFLLFIVYIAYTGYWQVRFVKTIQRTYPDKKGDPSSMKFQQQWLESCDEAEREAIFQGAYKAYITTSKLLPILSLLTMLAHLMWNTGIMAVFAVGVVQITLTVSYTRACLSKKSQQLMR